MDFVFNLVGYIIVGALYFIVAPIANWWTRRRKEVDQGEKM